MWSKYRDVLKRKILMEDIKTTADLWKWLKNEVSEAASESLLMMQRPLFNATLQHDEQCFFLCRNIS